jgi:hypothetical protein
MENGLKGMCEGGSPPDVVRIRGFFVARRVVKEKLYL